MTNKMSRQEEHEFYADPEHQTPQRPAQPRRARLAETIPLRFSPDILDRILRRAGEHDRDCDAS